MLKQITRVLLAASLMGATAASAQTMDNGHGWLNHDITGAVQLQVTYRDNNLDGLNQILNKNNIPSLGQNDIWINASMLHIRNNWIWEDGLGFTPITTSQTTNNLKARYNQYQAYLRLGYNVAQNADMRLYPFIGANFSGAVLNIQDNARQQNTSDFSQELLNSTSSKTLYQPNFGIELGGGFDYLIKLTAKKMDNVTIERSIPIGLRAGYYINTYASDWKIDDYGLGGSPNQKHSAVFVSFNIGLGYVVKR